jgi:hypothetical protein
MLKFAVHHLRLLSEPRRRHTSKTKSDTSASVCLYSKSYVYYKEKIFRCETHHQMSTTVCFSDQETAFGSRHVA